MSKTIKPMALHEVPSNIEHAELSGDMLGLFEAAQRATMSILPYVSEARYSGTKVIGNKQYHIEYSDVQQIRRGSEGYEPYVLATARAYQILYGQIPRVNRKKGNDDSIGCAIGVLLSPRHGSRIVPKGQEVYEPGGVRTSMISVTSDEVFGIGVDNHNQGHADPLVDVRLKIICDYVVHAATGIELRSHISPSGA